MKILSSVLLGLSLTLVGGAGCKKADPYGAALSKFEGFKNKACACKDIACAEGVKKEFETWMGTMEKTMKAAGKPSKEQDEKFDKLDDEMDACVGKLEEAAKPAAPATPPAPTTPPAEPPAAGSDAGSAAAPAAGSGSAM